MPSVLQTIHGNVHIRVSTARGFQRFVPLVPCDEDVEVLFHCVNNAFIYRLTLDFRPENLPFFAYLRANANELQCQVGALIIICFEAGIDYALIDFVGVHLKPQVYKMSMANEFREDYAMLIAHNALRGSVTQLDYG
ncbi:hypothetical protein AAVH_19857, partial [Aphelenchoides avenae]